MLTSDKPLRIGIVAGEYSGDLIAADLIEAIKARHPHVIFEGIAGSKMVAAGCVPLFSIDSLAVMFFAELIFKIPHILKIRYQILQHFIKNPPDIFIGVDAPAFNLALEKKLKKHNIRTVHYNSPKVWAWRRGRLKLIAKATTLMLTLFPFEEIIYKEAKIPVQYVGHPLADALPIHPDKNKARQELGLPQDATIVALLPGSRAQELKYLTKTFLDTACWCLKRNPNIVFVTSLVNDKRYQQFMTILKQYDKSLSVKVFVGQSWQVMTASNATLIASGTATLEAMLLKCPMVVAYRLSKISYHILKYLVHCRFIALPNLLTDKALVPELIQNDATPEKLGETLLNYLNDSKLINDSVNEFTAIHERLRCHSREKASKAILELMT